MAFSPLSISRKRVFGDLYPKCEHFTEDIPVYLLLDENELLGHADQSLGIYADAVTFYLADDVCKRLSAGQYTYEFDLEKSAKGGSVIVRAIFLKERKPYEKPLAPRRPRSDTASGQ